MKRRRLNPTIRNISAAFLNLILPGVFIGHLYIKRDIPRFLLFFVSFWIFIFIYDGTLIIFSIIIFLISIADAHKSIKLNELLGKTPPKDTPKRHAKSSSVPLNQTQSFEKKFEIGRKFEDYVIERLTPNFDILGRDARGKPDLKVISKEHGNIFWIECKYRNKFDIENGKPGVRWAKKEVTERYKGVELASKEKVFIVIGMGDKASRPKRMFLFPRSEGYDGFLFDWKIKEHERDPEAIFSYSDFQLF